MLLDLLLGILCYFYFCNSAFCENRVITKNFNWKICTTKHFDIYYYGDGENILPMVSNCLEKAYKHVTSYLNYDIPGKSSFFLYIGHNDFEETNIADIGEGTGGVTEAFKYRFVVPQLGHKKWLEYVIRHEFTHVVEFNILFNGFWKSIRLVKMPLYPLWLMEGLAEYSTENVGATEREMYLRDAVANKILLPVEHLHNFNHLKPHQVVLAYKESHALMQFIAEEYGEDKLGLLLTAYREKFDPNSVLYEVIGLSLSELGRKFNEYIEEKFSEDIANRKKPTDYGQMLTTRKTYFEFNTSPVFSPDSKSIAFISDRKGYNEILLMELKDRKSRSLVSQKHFYLVENISTEGHALSFSHDGRYLVFAGEKEQRDYIYVYDFNKKEVTRLKIDNIEILKSPCFSPISNKIIFVGLREGYSDIYSIDFQKGKERYVAEQLTHDSHDDSDAIFSPDGSMIVFSSERDTNDFSNPTQRDLYILKLADMSIQRLTKTLADETKPCFSPDGKVILFTADYDGVNDIYEYELGSGNIKRLTQVIGGNFEPSFSPDSRYIVFSSFFAGERHIYLAETKNFGYETLAAEQEKLVTETTISTGTTFYTDFREYRFKFSTDLFYPLLYYSTYEGLYFLTYWQASEFLGNHQISLYSDYIGYNEALRYELSYSYLRFRPQFFVKLRGEGGYVDYINKKYSNYLAQLVGISYPLDRFNRLELAAINSELTNFYRKGDMYENPEQENIVSCAFIHEAPKGKYLEVTSGERLLIGADISSYFFNGKYVYQNIVLESHRFFPLGKEHVLGVRNLLKLNSGKDRIDFYLGGFNRIRGYSAGDDRYRGNRLFVTNIEYRFPIVNDLNYYMWYLFPDFFFRSFYGIIFTDLGYAWNDDNFRYNELRQSIGIGLRFHTFILQAYLLSLNFWFCWPTDIYNTVFYFSLGGTF